MFRKGKTGKGFIDPLMAQVLCLHGVFAGLGFMMLALLHH